MKFLLYSMGLPPHAGSSSSGEKLQLMILHAGEKVSAENTTAPANCIPHFVTLFGSLLKSPSSEKSSSTTPCQIAPPHSLTPLPGFVISSQDFWPPAVTYIICLPIICPSHWDVSALWGPGTFSLLHSQHLELCLAPDRLWVIFPKWLSEWICSMNPTESLQRGGRGRGQGVPKHLCSPAQMQKASYPPAGGWKEHGLWSQSSFNPDSHRQAFSFFFIWTKSLLWTETVSPTGWIQEYLPCKVPLRIKGVSVCELMVTYVSIWKLLVRPSVCMAVFR